MVARKREYLPYIKKALTSEAVADYFGHLLEDKSKVQRYVKIIVHSVPNNIMLYYVV